MKTTTEVRSKAVRVSAAILVGYQPDRQEIEEMAMTIGDCMEVFKVHYPVISSIKKCIDRLGNVPRDFADIWAREVVPAVRALHNFDRQQEEGR